MAAGVALRNHSYVVYPLSHFSILVVILTPPDGTGAIRLAV